MTKQISICVATYNHEKYIEQALQSLLAQQTDLSYEIVIGDDCSSDRTGEIVDRYSRNYPERIRVLTRQQRLGMHENIRRTYAACTGEIVFFLEGDDYWCDPQKLNLLWHQFETNSACGLVFHTVKFQDDASSPHYTAGAETLVRPAQPLQNPIALAEFWRDNMVPTFSASAVRKQALPEIPLSLNQFPVLDWPCWVAVAHRYQVIHVPQVLGIYRRHGTNVYSTLSRATSLASKIKLQFLFYQQESADHQAIIFEQISQNLSRMAVIADEQVASIYQSKSYQLGHAILQPLRILKGLFRRFCGSHSG